MRRYALFLLLGVIAVAASALEVEQGIIKLVLDEDSSRFSLYQKVDAKWVPLFVADDPRTSALDVLEGNRVFRMGESGSFSQIAEKTDTGARYVWKSPTLEVVQSFDFTRGVDDSSTDALQMTVTLTNAGEEPSTVGVRVLFDTYLGEHSNIHFITPGSSQITRESSLTPGPVNRYVASAENANSGYGFQVMLSAEAVTTPQSVVVANWKRLSDSTWQYDVNATRNFNRLPYSINDSAILVTYAPAQLVSGGQYSIVAQFGALSDGGYLPPSIAAQSSGADPVLDRLAAILSEINTLMSSDTIDVERVTRLKEELESISALVSGR